MGIYHQFSAIYRFRHVISSYVETRLKIRYRRSYLGFFWTVLAPLLHYSIIGAVFTVIMRSPIPNYFQFYILGALLFSLISGVLQRAPSLLVANEHFIKKVAVPKVTYIISGALYEATNFIFGMLSIVALGLITQQVNTSWYMLFSVFSIVLLVFFLIGISAMISILTVYFRDLDYITPVLVQIFFFLSPVIYDKSMLPAKYHMLIDYNPMSYFIYSFRNPIINQSVGQDVFQALIICSVIAFTTFFLGLWFVDKYEDKIVFKL